MKRLDALALRGFLHALLASAVPRGVTGLALGAGVATGIGVATLPAPVLALTVYDPANHTQNVLQATRALEQIRLQTEALALQVRSLAASPYDHAGDIGQALKALDTLAREARGLAATIGGLDAQFETLYPGRGAGPTGLAGLEAAAARIEASRQTARDLARTAASVTAARTDRAGRLSGAMAAGRSAQGETAALQASLQTLGVLAEQLEGLQTLFAAQARLAAEDAARRAADAETARTARAQAWSRGPSPPPPPRFSPFAGRP